VIYIDTDIYAKQEMNWFDECIIQIFQLPRFIFNISKFVRHESFTMNSRYKMSIQLFNRLTDSLWELFMIS